MFITLSYERLKQFQCALLVQPFDWNLRHIGKSSHCKNYNCFWQTVVFFVLSYLRELAVGGLKASSLKMHYKTVSNRAKKWVCTMYILQELLP